jgi:hypothetical protein
LLMPRLEDLPAQPRPAAAGRSGEVARAWRARWAGKRNMGRKGYGKDRSGP